MLLYFLSCRFNFLISKFAILMNFFLYILWIKIVDLSPWQCFLLCLISSQEGANKYKLFLIFNTRSTNIFYSKSKFTQVCFSLTWLGNVMLVIKKCNSASNYILIIHIDLKPRILITSFLLVSLLINVNVFFVFLTWSF